MNRGAQRLSMASARQGSLTVIAKKRRTHQSPDAARKRAWAALRPSIGDRGIEQLLADASTPKEMLREVNRLVQRARMALNECVAAARLEGLSWERIGEATDLTRQSAHERWRWIESKEKDDAA